MTELTKYQIGQIEQMIGQDHAVHWELKRGERVDIERLISISWYHGIRHRDGSPLRCQRTHTNWQVIIISSSFLPNPSPNHPPLGPTATKYRYSTMNSWINQSDQATLVQHCTILNGETRFSTIQMPQ